MDRLAALALNDQGFVFDPATGSSYTLNPTGLMALRGLRDGEDDAVIADRIVSACAADPIEVQRDLAAFRRRLAALGLG